MFPSALCSHTINQSNVTIFFTADRAFTHGTRLSSLKTSSADFFGLGVGGGADGRRHSPDYRLICEHNLHKPPCFQVLSAPTLSTNRMSLSSSLQIALLHMAPDFHL
eukprot:TRINITY_DN42345_c1_g1_i2.p1 TRINITY_DN42345_c1_g1~~TRINITY_DN42345_c1_g1_i2.p1  ORF type:complete len:107 (-),score=6.75 TRINITY_DN42345_c1_g1_i2:5-325(-)